MKEHIAQEFLETLRRRERAARNTALRARLAEAHGTEDALLRLRSLTGLNAQGRTSARKFA